MHSCCDDVAAAVAFASSSTRTARRGGSWHCIFVQSIRRFALLRLCRMWGLFSLGRFPPVAAGPSYFRRRRGPGLEPLRGMRAAGPPVHLHRTRSSCRSWSRCGVRLFWGVVARFVVPPLCQLLELLAVSYSATLLHQVQTLHASGHAAVLQLVELTPRVRTLESLEGRCLNQLGCLL